MKQKTIITIASAEAAAFTLFFTASIILTLVVGISSAAAVYAITNN